MGEGLSQHSRRCQKEAGVAESEANLEVCPSHVPELQRLGGRSHALIVNLFSTLHSLSVLRNAASDEGPAGSAWPYSR